MFATPNMQITNYNFQMFATPNMHPKSKPFYDHVLGFTYLDGRIWFRNFQVNYLIYAQELR